jgi:pyrrolidone-carboxylate peptidase
VINTQEAMAMLKNNAGQFLCNCILESKLHQRGTESENKLINK